MISSAIQMSSKPRSLKIVALTKREIKHRLQQIYDQIPSVDCHHCQACSSPIFWFKPEEIMIRDYLTKQGRDYITWTEKEFKQHDMKCPYLENNRCSIYPVRPIVCRLQGTTTELPCKYNNKTIMTSQQVAEIKQEMNKLVQETNGVGRYFGTRKLSFD